jgi:xylulokinase
MGIDIGTSSLKVLILKDNGLVCALCGCDYQYDSPMSGFAEQDPEIWWEACVTGINNALAMSGLSGNEIDCVGFSGQMHGLVTLDKNGNCIRPAILHNDARSEKQVDEIKNILSEENIKDLLMNPVYTGFWLPSLLWIRENEPDNYNKIAKLCFPKDFIRYKLTGEIATDFSDASASLLFDIKNLTWSEHLLKTFNFSETWFPDCETSGAYAGNISKSAAILTNLPTNVKVAFGGADAVMQALGNGALGKDIVTANIGSSGQICFQTETYISNPDLTTNTFCGFERGRWITMGAIMHAGLAKKWIHKVLKTSDYKELDDLASTSKEGSGLIFLPYLNGERTPHLNPNLTGLFLGITMGTTDANLARAVMEGVAFALKNAMEVCEGLGLKADGVIASGGGAKSEFWLQILSDIFALPVKVSKSEEQAALGAAITAGVCAGAFNDYSEGVRRSVKYSEKEWLPDTSRTKLYEKYYELYKDAYEVNKDLLVRLRTLGRQ